MPVYQYRCPACDAPFEAYAYMADSQQAQPCPECGAQARRHYTKAPAFIMRPKNWNKKPGEEGYDSDFEKREFTQARYN